MRTLILAAAAATLIAAPMIGLPAFAAKRTASASADDGSAPSIKSCSAKWRGYTDEEKDAYKAKAEGKVGKTGRKLSGYNVFTSECMKH